MRNLELSVGDTKPLRWWFESSKTRRPVILTGHTITLEVTLSGGVEPIIGDLFEGDCGVYFTIPDTINSIADANPYRIIDVDADGEQITIETGKITYK